MTDTNSIARHFLHSPDFSNSLKSKPYKVEFENTITKLQILNLIYSYCYHKGKQGKIKITAICTLGGAKLEQETREIQEGQQPPPKVRRSYKSRYFCSRNIQQVVLQEIFMLLLLLSKLNNVTCNCCGHF